MISCSDPAISTGVGLCPLFLFQGPDFLEMARDALVAEQVKALAIPDSFTLSVEDVVKEEDKIRGRILLRRRE